MGYIGPNEVIRKRKEYLYPSTAHFYKNPPQFVKGYKQYLYDHEGKRYTDFFAGVSVMSCGHSNPEIINKTIEQLQNLQHTTIIYLTEPIVNLAEKLAKILPGDISRTFFCVTGSEANDGALTLARIYTKKKGFIALKGGLHGRTYLTQSVTGIPMWRTDDYLDEEQVYFLDRPYEVGVDLEIAAEKTLGQLKEVLEAHGHEIAGMILEPIQGNGGIVPFHKDFMKKAKALLEKHNILLIDDEIQTGYGRTGKMFAIEHYDVVPDIIVTAKALGNGMPISTFSTTNEIGSCFTRPSASTFGGNSLASTQALTVLDFIEEHDLAHHSEKLGAILKSKLEEFAKRFNFIADVRGKGLMIGMQLKDGFKGKSSAELVDIILEEMKDRGFIIGKNGLARDVLAFQPPLVVEEADISSMLTNLEEVLSNIQ